jgi:hypothetical protein
LKVGGIRGRIGLQFLFKSTLRQGEIAMSRIILIIGVAVGVVFCSASLADGERVIGGKIDFVDYSIFAEHWLDSYCIPCEGDFTGDLTVDFNDLEILSAHWLEEYFLAPSYEYGIYAGGLGGVPLTFVLRGTGNPTPITGGEYGGRDKVNGNMFVDGDADMYEESSVNPALPPNPYGIGGDVDAMGDIDIYDSATISGDVNSGAAAYSPADLAGMNYAVNNTHNVSQIFADAGVSSGYLPVGHLLRDVFVINPADRSAECASTAGDDFFFEPSSGFIVGSWQTAPTPLHAGVNRIYYIDGDLWMHSKSTFGFDMDGKVTMIVTGDMHICDNLQYANADSILGLVALGEYDPNGELISGGDVIFGDPVYGTVYTFSGMILASNDFLFNSQVFGSFSAEPKSGFTVNGNLAAMNIVSIERDWYSKWNGFEFIARPARYNDATSQWVDSETGAVLTTTEISTLRHYQMIVNYDDRVRSPDTQPPGLPRGDGAIPDYSPLR